MEEIISSVMQSPENTNPNVLRGQLQKIGGGGVQDINGTPLGQHKYSVNKPMSEIAEAMQNGARIRATTDAQGYHVEYYLYLAAIVVVDGELRILVTTSEADEPLSGSESDGVTTFGPA